jgi:hypothetical protein
VERGETYVVDERSIKPWPHATFKLLSSGAEDV